MTPNHKWNIVVLWRWPRPTNHTLPWGIKYKQQFVAYSKIQPYFHSTKHQPTKRWNTAWEYKSFSIWVRKCWSKELEMCTCITTATCIPSKLLLLNKTFGCYFFPPLQISNLKLLSYSLLNENCWRCVLWSSTRRNQNSLHGCTPRESKKVKTEHLFICNLQNTLFFFFLQKKQLHTLRSPTLHLTNILITYCKTFAYNERLTCNHTFALKIETQPAGSQAAIISFPQRPNTLGGLSLPSSPF